MIFMMMGAVLMLSALLLFLYNGYEAYRAGQQAERLLDDIHSAIAEETVLSTKPAETDMDEEIKMTQGTESTQVPQTLPAEMPEVIIHGYGCIGYLSIPSLELELPVISEWDYSRLRVAPCRHFGSSRTDDLVIAAHNYDTHFGLLSELETGMEVTFTDMDGIENRYTLKKLDTLVPEDVKTVQNSGYDLVLYTCTPGGAARVVAFCNRMTEDAGGDGSE